LNGLSNPKYLTLKPAPRPEFPLNTVSLWIN
jgi:hypothetical protein